MALIPRSMTMCRRRFDMNRKKTSDFRSETVRTMSITTGKQTHAGDAIFACGLPIKYFVLLMLTVQNAGAVIMMR